MLINFARRLLNLSPVLVGLLLLIAGCSIEVGSSVKKLDRDSAAQLLEEYYEAENTDEIKTIFSEGEAIAELTLEDPGDMAILNAELAKVEAKPLLGFSDRVCLSLTEAGKAFTDQWEKDEREGYSEATEDCPYDTTWIIPLGSLVKLEVTGIQTLSETSAKVEFDTEYDPNEMGKILQEVGLDNPFRSSSVGANIWEDTISRTASLELYDDGWRVTSIE